MLYKPVSGKASFPQLEQEVLDFWKRERIFEKSFEGRAGAPVFTLFEGPPTANGNPGIHHVLARVFKDVIPRYKTMKGYRVFRKAGWDTHGLPVELEVERSLGFTSKSQIEEYGVDKFNKLCRESVLKYLSVWESLTERIGFWVDLNDPYVTFKNDYIESGWWVLNQLWEKNLIYQGHRVTPHCPRCGTSLSSHEVALGYKDNTVDPSVYMKFRISLKDSQCPPELESLLGAAPSYLLAWTTTPWTLPGNVAVAVNPAAEYVIVEVAGEAQERLVLAAGRLSESLTEQYTVLARIPGSDLTCLKYEPLFNPAEVQVPVRQFECRPDGQIVLVSRRFDSPEQVRYPVVAGDFVGTDEGTGIVHIAPSFGEIDYHVGECEKLYFIQPVDLRGIIADPGKKWPFAGKFVKQADPLVLADLKARGLLYRSGKITHTYPFCWRCDTPLLYYAKRSWYIRTTAVKDRMVAGNEKINWFPEHVKYGRFGDWLENNVDWAFSRERYWGTPLNLWVCPDCYDPAFRKGIQSISGLDELRKKPGLQGLEEPVDLHRPYVDKVTFNCPDCGGKMHRVPEVIDCWFDSGAMPVAQFHYPFENQELFKSHFPADYICEAVDQTRGWFYSLHALSTLLFDQPCFKNVICLGHILDAKGEKMSKTKGNVVDPWKLLNDQGADALRWYLLTAVPPGNVRRFSPEQVTEALRSFLLTLQNTYSFFVTYANIDNFKPSANKPAKYDNELDRWIISELNKLIKSVDESLASYDPTTAARRVADFVDYLSNWYIRRSRRRFWKSENDSDKLTAYGVLYECLVTAAKLLAPMTPFISEQIYRNLVCSIDEKAPESVHLTAFPVADGSRIDEALDADTRLAMKVSSLGRSARSKAAIKVRQPLARVLIKVKTPAEAEGLKRLSYQVLDELNVKAIEFIEDESGIVQFEVKPNLVLLGPKYGKELGEISGLLAKADANAVARAALSKKEIALDGYTLTPDEVLVKAKEKAGYSAVMEGGYLVAADSRVTPELAEEGLAREVVHRLQTIRRDAGFDIADYIETHYQADGALREIIQKFAPYIQQETLSKSLVEGPPVDGAHLAEETIDGKKVTFSLKKV